MKKTMILLFTCCTMLIFTIPVQAEISYGDVYADAVVDAMARHMSSVKLNEVVSVRLNEASIRAEEHAGQFH